MQRKLMALFMLLAMLLLPATALAHGSSANAIAHEETIEVGPYRVRVGFNEWPLKAKKSVEFTVHPEDGIEGKDGWIIFPAPVGMEGHEHRDHLERWPGVDDAWVFQMAGYRDPGPKRLKIELNTAQGKFVGETTQFMVADPPNVPEWVGWAVGLVPLYGIIWFGFREKKRVKLAAAADGGARL